MIIDFLLFLLGVHLCTRLIAACYGIVDLWYCWRQYWHQMLGNILLWAAIVAGVGLIAAPVHHTAYMAGLAFFVVFHIVIYWVGQLLARLI
jgi:hypothetical protein